MRAISRDNHLLELLLHESAEVRDDDRYMFTQYAAIVSVAVVVIGAMATVFYLTCPAGYSNCSADGRLTPVSVWIYIGAPMLPIVLIAYAVLISAILTLRSYYLRTLEVRIHQLTGQAGDRLPVPSWAHIGLEVTGQTHSGRWGLLNLFLIYGIISLMVVECLYLALSKIPTTRLRVFAMAVDGTLLAILTSAAVLNIAKGRLLWEAALERLPGRLLRTNSGFPRRSPATDERSLGSFLLLPRNQEELLKALFIPICFAIGRWLSPSIPELTYDMFWYSLGFFLVFEFVIYQARYLLNDVRDREVDCRPGLTKPRFPCSWINDPERLRFALKAAFGSFLARLLIAGLLVGCVFPYTDWKWAWHVGFLTGVFVIALPYESFRSRCIAAANARSGRRAAFLTVAVISVVGLGYGLRSALGLWLAGVEDKFALLLLALGASFFGSTFVALTWALESTRADEDALARGKGHLVLFRRMASRAADHAKVPLRHNERVLAGWQPLLAPWCIAAVLATTGLAAFAFYLLRDYRGVVVYSLHVGAVSQWVVVTAGLASITGLAVVAPIRASVVLTLLNAAVVGIVLHHHSEPVAKSALAAVIVALPLIVTCSFRNMRFDDLPNFTTKLIRVGAGGAQALYSWFAQAR